LTCLRSKRSDIADSDHAVRTDNLKHEFQWLKNQSSADTIVVDEKTNASFLEHLVFMYDLRLLYCIQSTHNQLHQFLSVVRRHIVPIIPMLLFSMCVPTHDRR